MVLSYDYSNRNRGWRRTNAPPLRAISMAMAVRRCHTEHISQCSMTSASPEATGRRHWATTRSILPRRQGNSKRNDDATTHFDGHFNGRGDAAVLYPAHHPRWRRFVAFTKATKHHHWASTRSDSINRTRQHQLFLQFHREKGSS
jgi:hypothetical protein